jgi:hypothetical protein
MKLRHPEKFNTPLAEKVLTWVTLYPQAHYQDWEFDHCSQTGCLMGWAAVFSGIANGSASPQELVLTYEEWEDIFKERSNKRAVEKLKDYIVQARAAQHTPDDYTLVHSDEIKTEDEIEVPEAVLV